MVNQEEKPLQYWHYADDLLRPDREHPEYELIRLYARKKKHKFPNEPDDYTLVDPMKLKNGDVLWTFVNEDIFKRGPKYHSYFVVIKRGVSNEMQWDNTPYVKVNQPWDARDVGRKESEAGKAAVGFIAEAIKVCDGASTPVAHCFGYAISEYQKKGPDAYRVEGVEEFKEQLNKRKAEEADKSGK
ncbi:MAG: hypothetical protein Q9209_003922 [Squamulea sp. 1 TL-2023]